MPFGSLRVHASFLLLHIEKKIMADTQYLCIDLEMSGSIPGEHDIIQIGAVLLDEDFKKLSTFETLVYPENEADFDPESKRIHGISRFELDEAPSLEEALDDMESWLRESGGYTSRRAMQSLKLCGQGINNDISFLKAAYHQVNLAWPFSYQSIDLQDISLFYERILIANKKEGFKGLSLNGISDFLGMQREKNKHDALEDAELTARCFEELFKRASLLKIE